MQREWDNFACFVSASERANFSFFICASRAKRVVRGAQEQTKLQIHSNRIAMQDIQDTQPGYSWVYNTALNSAESPKHKAHQS